jgi:methylenetetrahydrofolate dehydrogenase (NADP+) / methenyltetrahydrofolate cyclohydrolase
MEIDGGAIALRIKKELKEEVEKSNIHYKLDVILVGKNDASKRFVEVKKRFAESIGVTVEVHHFKESTDIKEIKDKIKELNSDIDSTGIIVQLPLPKHLNTEEILNTVSFEKDVDVLGREALLKFKEDADFKRVPAVVGAIEEIFTEHNIEKQNKKIVIVGQGRLVGEPVALWLERAQVPYEVVDKDTPNRDEAISIADIVISGTGVPYMILTENIKDGVVVIDAGTSMKDGELVGDVHPDSATKASLITPVPGGVGPITVTIVFRNLITSV